MAIGGEVFGSCVGGIYVSVEQKNVVGWLCCGWNYLGFILAGKAAQHLGWRRAMVPGIGGHFDALGVIEEIKTPCGCRGFER